MHRIDDEIQPTGECFTAIDVAINTLHHQILRITSIQGTGSIGEIKTLEAHHLALPGCFIRIGVCWETCWYRCLPECSRVERRTRNEDCNHYIIVSIIVNLLFIILIRIIIPLHYQSLTNHQPSLNGWTYLLGIRVINRRAMIVADLLLKLFIEWSRVGIQEGFIGWSGLYQNNNIHSKRRPWLRLLINREVYHQLPHQLLRCALDAHHHHFSFLVDIDHARADTHIPRHPVIPNLKLQVLLKITQS